MKNSTGVTLYTYDDLARLAGVTDPSGRKVGYEYDETGAVTAVTYPEGQTARYGYDSLGRLETVCSPQGNYTYAYDDLDRPVKLNRPNGLTTTYSYDPVGDLSLIENTKPKGDLVSGYLYTYDAYSPFGLPAANGRLNPSHKLNDGNTFGFGGQDHDPVFGQVYLRARYYTPGLGRFTTPDPLVMAGLDLPGMSPYAYGQDNPLAYLDPSGLVVEKVNKGLTATLAAQETGLSVAGAAILVVMLALTRILDGF
ncbi:MAG: RHS repeat-associated core domain-containing protein [Bacillota bacterium]